MQPIIGRASFYSALFCSVLLMGAECHPTAAPCSGDADGDGTLDCEEGEYPQCLSLCLELGHEGEACVLDPCDAGAGATVCATGFTCMDGACQTATSLPLLGCDPALPLGEAGSCSSGTYCARFGECAGVERPRWLEQSPFEGICLLPAQEGEPCTGVWNDMIGAPAVCEPCAPGLACEPAPWNEAINVCQRTCSTDDECPCEGSAEQEPGCDLSTGHCRICLRSQVECDPEQGQSPECCDAPLSMCNQVLVVEDGEMSVSRWSCCRGTGVACESDAQCCSNARCLGGQCELCGSYPGASPGEAGCCPGLVLRTPIGGDPVCGRPCPRAEAENEEDRICRHGTGACGTEVQHWTCDTVVGDVCPGAEEEEAGWMEGRDCVSMEWTETCGEEVEGEYTCTEEGLTCEVGLNDVCTSPFHEFECGRPCFVNPADIPQGQFACSTDDQCAPGSFCSGVRLGTGEWTSRDCVCCVSPQAPTCWDPVEDRGGCNVYPYPP